MRSFSNLLLASAAVLIGTASAEKVLGAFIFARHGDRTAKVLGNTQLTNLGYQEVYQTGSFYHDRYVAPDSPLQIDGISQPVVNQLQIYASATADDDVIDNSGMGFLQGLYPPVGTSASQTLRNGTTIQSPLDGYQLIRLSPAFTGSNSENSDWIQGASGCQQAAVSSNQFFSSSLYYDLENSTKGFYQSLSPILGSAFSNDKMSFRNAYTIYDYINVARIHNSTQSTPMNGLTNSDFHQLLALANAHEYHLSYNESEKIRAISGSVLAGAVVEGLNKTIATQGKSKLGVQLGPYSTFLSYFGLAQMPPLSPYFEGIPVYASSMAWELVTNSTASGFPAISDISVRFLFHNGTLSSSDILTPYPLFGQPNLLLPWSEFVDRNNKIAITGSDQWCRVCGNTTGECAAYSSSGSRPSSSNSNKMSLGVAGVIGAMVTLGVILGLEGLFLMFGGVRLGRKRPAAPVIGSVVTENNKA